MPYEIDWEEHGVYSRFFGTISGEELIRHARQIAKDPRTSELKYEISNFTAIEGHTVQKSDVLFAAATDSLLESVPLAVVHSLSRPSDLELIERHRNSPLMKRRPIKAFNSEFEAREWIKAIIGR